MKFISSASVVLASILAMQVHSMPATASHNGTERRDAQACGLPTVPLLRAYHPGATDHFYTTNVAEMGNAISNLGYQFEGVAASVLPSQAPNSVPLYRMYSGSPATDHFYTTNAAERDNAVHNLGYVDEGIAAYVYLSSNFCNSVPLYRVYTPGDRADHFYTTSASERDNAVNNLGYINNEGVAAYVNPQ